MSDASPETPPPRTPAAPPEPGSAPPPLPPSAPPPGAAPLPGTAPTPGASAATAPVPQDTDDTRHVHFRRLSRHPVTLSIGVTLAIAALVVGTLASGVILIGLGAAIGAFLLALLIVFLLASGKAKEDFFRAYADGRGLNRLGKGLLPPGTPLLRRGDDRYAHQIMRGALPGGLEGTLALYTYEETHRDSDGDRQTTYYHFTVVLADVPESAVHVGELYCQRRVGFRFLDSAEDVFRTRERITLESEALDQRCEIFAGRGEDPNWIRQLFQPSFVHWLGDEAPDGIAFELVAGLLCVNVKGHLDSAADLDRMSEAAAAIAQRVREESLETAV
jgi:hypothetical protein